MCDVNYDETGEEDDPTIQEDDALEKIFSECDVPSTGRVSVAKLIGYMRDRMSAHGSPKILKELHKLMSVVSRDGDSVTREQYYAASQVWLAKIRKRQHYQDNHQDGNNNLHVDHNSDSFIDDPVSNELSGNTSRVRTTLVLGESADDIHLDAAGSGSDSDARNIQGYHDLSTSTVVDTNERCDSQDAFFGDLSSVDGTFHMAFDHPVAETAQGLRQRAQRCALDNDHLREELQRAEDSIASLEKQLVTIGHKLELANTRCERLQGEHEENRDLLASAEKDRKALEARNHRLDKENCQLKKEIEAAETEMRRLNAELDKANGQKEERIRLLSRCRQELIERQTLYDEAKRQISHLEMTNDQLKEKHDISTSTTEHLKVVVKELETRIAELQPNQNYILHGEELFANSSSDNYGGDSVTEIFQKSEKLTPCSLLDEMKAIAGFGDPEVDVEICRNSNDTIEDQNTNIIEYIDAMHWATEQLERATAELSASNKELGIGPSPSRNPVVTAQSYIQTGDEAIENEENFSNTEDLRHFKSQIRHVLTILSLMASRKVMNADTKDATTQADCLGSISELPPACNIHGSGTDSYINNNSISYDDKFCPTCKRENRSSKKEDEALTVDARPEVAPVEFTSPLVPPLDVSSLEPRVTSTPCCSPPLSSSPLSSGYFREREIIVPIVAALDEIIQGTSDSGNDGEATYSPMGSRRERNPRYIYTLPSGQPYALEGDLLCDGETPLSTMPTNAINNPLARSQNKVIVSGGNVQKSFAWRCPESNTPEDTSDDTYDATDSIKSDSRSFEESNYRSSTANLSGTMSSLQSNENCGFEREGKNITAAFETDSVEVLTPASIRDRILSLKGTTGNHDSDVVEGLDLDLKKLTLKTEISDDRNCEMHTKCQRQEMVMNTHDHPMHMIVPAAGHPLHGKVPKRKSSVYQRSFDYYSRPNVSQKTARKKSAGSVIVRKSAVPDHTAEPDESSPQRHRPSFYTGRHNEPDILHSLKPDYTAETWKSLAKVLPERGNDTTRLSGRVDGQQQEEEGPRNLKTAYENMPAELDEYPREESGELLSGLARIIMHDRCLHGVQDTPISPSTVKPTKSEVSLGNRRTEYVISDRQSPTPTHCLPSNNGIPGDIASAKAAERRSDGREVSTRSRSVARAMSSEEDSSDSECARDRIQREENVQVVVLPLPLPSPPPPPPPPPQQQTRINPPPVPSSINLPQQQQASVLQTSSIGISSSLLLGDPLPYRRHREDTNQQRITDGESDGNSQRRSKNSQRLRRSLSESDSGPCRGSAECRSKCNCNCCWNRASNKIICVQSGAVDTPEGLQDRPSLRVFPNLPDARLIELGLASSSDGFDLCERMGEDELEKKYTALSIGLGTDRITLPRRLALSLRQRDQAERNLTTEVERMQRDIQALAPLCVDRESVERVERVRHQLEMISRCALRVSCTAELLGATHQERRVSRAALLADRYLQALRARCDKISAELAETKRILIENNIVIEENSSELIDDVVPRARYRGVPSANRTTMTRRRASIATIIRPTTVNPLQEATKDNPRQQRSSVPARMTLRRPSLGYDNQRWDNEKLDRTDSSSSIGELREIFEQAESRRSSREENNNLIRSQSSHFSVGSCESGDTDLWASTRDDTVSFQAQTKDEELSDENWSSSRRTPLVFRTIHERVSRLPISWYILFVAIFFFGFYSNRFVTTRSAVPLKWWSVDEIMKRYLHVQRNVPPPL